MAFRSFAAASGRVGRLNVYLAPTSSARRVELGLYRNRSGPAVEAARALRRRRDEAGRLELVRDAAMTIRRASRTG